eukprot:603653_1
MYFIGHNRNKQFGQTTQGKRLTKCEWNKDQIPKQIALGRQHALYICNQSIFVSGDNEYGQCGIDNDWESIEEIQQLPFNHSTKAVYTNCTARHSFIQTQNNDIYAFGRNDHGQLTLDSSVKKTQIPTQINTPCVVKNIGTGEEHSLCLSMDGDVYKTQGNAWKLIDGLAVKTVKISTGPHHVLTINAKGTVVCFGGNSFGQCGIGTKDDVPDTNPVAVSSIKSCVVDIAAGCYHSIVVDENGVVFTFGNNEFGQCGQDEEEEYILSPAKVMGIPPIQKVKAGSYHTAVITRTQSKQIFMFGSNGDGQCIVAVNEYEIFKPVSIDEEVVKQTGKHVEDVYLGNDATVVITREDDQKESFEVEEKAQDAAIDDQELKKYKEELAAMNSKYDDVCKENNTRIVALEDEKNALEKRLNDEINAKSAQIAALEKEKALNMAKQMSIKAKYEALLEQYNESVKSLDKAQRQVGLLMEEQKEKELEINQLKEENKSLKLKCIDVSAYASWQWEEILQWIMMIEDGRFRKYEKDLAKTLAEEKPKGEEMQYIDGSDVKRWGVTTFGDIKVLCAQIKALVSQRKDDDMNVAIANKEGNVSGGHYR